MNHRVRAGIVPNDAQELFKVLGVFLFAIQKFVARPVHGEDVATNLPIELLYIEVNDFEGLEFARY